MDQEKTTEWICPVIQSTCAFYEDYQRLKEELKNISRLVETDTLTDLYNYNHLREALHREMERTRRTGQPTGLIMADLDHFKLINDLHGHQAGNAVLQAVSALWKKNLRLTDIPCRYGGEEFTFVLPGTTLSQAVRIAERLRSMLEKTPIAVNGREITITASFGVEVCRVRDAFSLDEFLSRADAFLLEAKRKGRNRVCCSEGESGLGISTELKKEERASLFIKRWSF